MSCSIRHNNRLLKEKTTTTTTTKRTRRPLPTSVIGHHSLVMVPTISTIAIIANVFMFMLTRAVTIVECAPSSSSTSSTQHSSVSSSSSGVLKIDPNTLELLNNGLKALVSIKQILTTIQAVSELSTLFNNVATAQQSTTHQQQQQYGPSMAAMLLSPSSMASPIYKTQSHQSRPKIGFMQKLLNKLLLQNNGANKLNLHQMTSSGSYHSKKLTKKESNICNKVERNPSIGLIKIGEKPPPGLFPETLPYSVSQLESVGSVSSSSPSITKHNDETLKIGTDFGTSKLVHHLPDETPQFMSVDRFLIDNFNYDK